jgi:hypothetical protein
MAIHEIAEARNPSLLTRRGRDKMRAEIAAAIETPRQAVVIAVVALIVACLAFVAVVMSVHHAA